METTTEIRDEIKTSTVQSLSDYELLSGLFIYPENESYAERIKDTHVYLSDTLPESAEAMKPFMDFTAFSTLQEIQELFLRSFDVQAITTLDIGFILFGEDYKRGQLLVNLNKEHREAENICYTELSDHLPNVLRLLPKMKNEEMRNEIARRLVIPSVVKMIDEFDNKKIEKKDEVYKKHLKTIIDFSTEYRTVYQSLLQALFIVLKNDFGYDHTVNEFLKINEEKEPIGMTCGGKSASCSCPPEENDYTRNIETEMNIENL